MSTVSMNNSFHHGLIYLYVFLLCWLVFLSSLIHVVEGDGTSISVHGSIKCIDYEREALLKFKGGIKSDNCGLLSSWGDIEDCCQWRGIRCNNHTGHVTVLQLKGDDYNHCLEGNLDSSLFELKHLRYLDLSSNSFYQHIPESIKFLTNLEYLNFSNTGFSGEIPHLVNLSRLTSLDLSQTETSTDILLSTSLHWLSHLTSLREINLSGSNLSKATNWVQIVNNLPSLRVLYLDDCQLPSISPSTLSYINSSTNVRVVSLSGNHLIFSSSSLFQWLLNLSKNGHQLEYLDLSDNSLSGSLPNAFGNMHSLSFLSLTRNNLEGLIPNTFSNLSSLEYLSLADNSFHGPIPDFMSNLKSLRFLYLSANNFHGSISNSLHTLCNLQELNLGDNNLVDDLSNILQLLSIGCANKPLLESLTLSKNQLWGSIPDMINKFSSLKWLYLDGNHLNGTISRGIGQLSMLKKLDVSNNSLEATLTHNHFSNLSQLSDLYLSDNSALVFHINADWIPPFQLEVIDLRSCKLGPYFPKWLLTQTNFFSLDISNAQISGSIPVDFWTETLSPKNLRSLNLSHNKFHGDLPVLSRTFDYLEMIDLSSNYFEGSIPSFLVASSTKLNNNKFSDATHLLCRKTEISPRSLDLSNNLLSGELPDCWNEFRVSVSLYLGHNNFSGNIPPSIGSLQELQFLHLTNNRFSGELPTSLENCTSLVVLDLSYNSLKGYIPSSVGSAFQNLGVLNLRSNKFHGKLPLSLCQLSYLHLLDLGDNHLTGTIPECIYNLTSMTDNSDNRTMERYNYLEDQEFRSMHQEIATYMWKKEEQEFKDSIMKLVKSIDLSRNELEGNIPDGISNLTGLILLDLSSNKLCEGIISNIGRLRSLDFLDLSNNHLSGEIPTSLAQVSTLGYLNLSSNNLSGKIPVGTQLQGFDPSSYKENPLLCGLPLKQCPGENSPEKALNEETVTGHKIEQDNDGIFPGLYTSVLLGFLIGFVGVFSSSLLKR